MWLVLVINSAFFTRDQSGIITFFHGTNAVRSVQTHSSPRVSLAREIATLTCIPKKNSHGVSKLTRRNLPLSLKLSACVFRYHELLFLAIYCLYLWQCGRLVMHLYKIEFQIEGEVSLGEREMALDLLRMMSGVQNKSPLPPPPNKNPVQNPDLYYDNQK